MRWRDSARSGLYPDRTHAGSTPSSDLVSRRSDEEHADRARDGRLAALGHTPTGGKAPRSFAIDPTGRWVLAANQLSDNINSFAIDPQKGTLKATGATLTVARPVCVLFV